VLDPGENGSPWFCPGVAVNGHRDFPTGGHGSSPRVATRPPRGRPVIASPAVRSVPLLRWQWLHPFPEVASRSQRLARSDPFGWRAEGKELVHDAREQEVIALARRLAAEGLSSRQVAARLEEGGHRPKTGERWSSVQVCRILPKRSVPGHPRSAGARTSKSQRAAK
jgi:hypothetical protein